MEKVKVQICIDADAHQWLIEEMVGRHHKNLSQTVRELLKNYQIMTRAVDNARLKAERVEKARVEAEQMAATYRSQAIK